MNSLLISTGLLVVGEALVLNLSTQVSLQQRLLRGYLALGIPIFGVLLALLAAARARAAQVADQGRVRVGDRQRGAGRRTRASADTWEAVASYGACAVVVVGWAAVFYVCSLLL